MDYPSLGAGIGVIIIPFSLCVSCITNIHHSAYFDRRIFDSYSLCGINSFTFSICVTLSFGQSVSQRFSIGFANGQCFTPCFANV